ncbi:MAG: hypothetical protein K9L22_00865 [Methylococcaceae bacterium]|nr:hypothetical protein [Methylococcaceae bacterium]
MSYPFALPFELTNQSITDWLKQLNFSDVLLVSNEIYHVLSVLKKEQAAIDTAALRQVIMRLTPVVMYLSGFLEQAMLKSAQQRKIPQMSIRILRHLSFLQLCLAKRTEQQDQRVLHLNYALQILGVAFKVSVLSYERPSAVLWQYMSECYTLASVDTLLDIPVEKPLADFQSLPTINLALKRLLLFWVANPYSFSQQDIQTFFVFCTLNSHLVKLVNPNLVVESVFCWDYSQNDCLQMVYSKPVKLPEKCVLFHANDLLHSEQKKSLFIAESERFFLRLSNYNALVGNTNFSLAKTYVITHGFEQLTAFFARHVHNNEVLRLNTPLPNDLNFTNLELVQDGMKKKPMIEHISPEDIWGGAELKKEKVAVKFAAMKLMQTAQAYFYGAETIQVNLVEGDVFVAYDASLKPVLGVVRRADYGQRDRLQQSVVQMLIGHVSVLLQSHLVVPKSALLLSHKDTFELFLEPGQYSVGTILKFDQVDVTLERLLELSPKFMRYAVSVGE